MTQLTLDYSSRDESAAQAAHLARVRDRLAGCVLDFLGFVGEGRTFHADDLRAAVERAMPGSAPGSADRILRDLRQRRVIDYIVVSRRRSEYRYLGRRASNGREA